MSDLIKAIVKETVNMPKGADERRFFKMHRVSKSGYVKQDPEDATDGNYYAHQRDADYDMDTDQDAYDTSYDPDEDDTNLDRNKFRVDVETDEEDEDDEDMWESVNEEKMPWADGKLQGRKLLDSDIKALDALFNGLDDKRSKQMMDEINKSKKDMERVLNFAHEIKVLQK